MNSVDGFSRLQPVGLNRVSPQILAALGIPLGGCGSDGAGASQPGVPPLPVAGSGKSSVPVAPSGRPSADAAAAPTGNDAAATNGDDAGPSSGGAPAGRPSVVIVGSGYGCAVAAMRLTEAGIPVTVFEMGRLWDKPSSDGTIFCKNAMPDGRAMWFKNKTEAVISSLGPFPTAQDVLQGGLRAAHLRCRATLGRRLMLPTRCKVVCALRTYAAGQRLGDASCYLRAARL